MIHNQEIENFRKEKLPMYVGIVNNSIAAQELYDYNEKKRQTLLKFQKLNKQYKYESQKLYDEFMYNKHILIKRLYQLNKTIEELTRITKKEKGE